MTLIPDYESSSEEGSEDDESDDGVLSEQDQAGLDSKMEDENEATSAAEANGSTWLWHMYLYHVQYLSTPNEAKDSDDPDSESEPVTV